MYRTILIAVDFSDASLPALHHGLELGRRMGARVVVLTVNEPPYQPRTWFAPLAPNESALFRDLGIREREASRAALEDLVRRERGEQREGFSPEVIAVPGIPADVIVGEATRAEADLIVMGTHGRRGLTHAMMGSIAERVVRTSPIPVLTVRSSTR